MHCNEDLQELQTTFNIHLDSAYLEFYKLEARQTVL